MTHPFRLLRPAPAMLLLAALPLVTRAQAPAGTSQHPTQAELLRRGDLVGGRPRATPPSPARAGTTAAPAPARASGPAVGADPVLARLLHENVALDQLAPAQLPGLYDRLLDAVHENYRQWNSRDWEDASAALSRLNARYEAVRLQLPLNQRANVRTAQGEFRALEAARRR